MDVIFLDYQSEDHSFTLNLQHKASGKFMKLRFLYLQMSYMVIGERCHVYFIKDRGTQGRHAHVQYPSSSWGNVL